MDDRAKERRRRTGTRLFRGTIGLTIISALSFLLSCIPGVSEWAWWSRPTFEIAGVCDCVVFFGLMYWQLVDDRADLLEPTKAAAEANRVLLQTLNNEITKLNTLQKEVCEIRDRVIHQPSIRRMLDAQVYKQRFDAEINHAISSEPLQQEPIIRMMRLSGHWKNRGEGREHSAESLERFFDTNNTTGEWGRRWEVKILFAVADTESLDALLNAKTILGKVLGHHPKNYTFRLIARQQFEPSIALAIIGDEVAFLAYDEFTDDPFPKGGLEIRGDLVAWYVAWFNEMFDSSCALRIYERGIITPAGIENLRKMLRPTASRH